MIERNMPAWRLRPPPGSLVSASRFERIVEILCPGSAHTHSITSVHIKDSRLCQPQFSSAKTHAPAAFLTTAEARSMYNRCYAWSDDAAPDHEQSKSSFGPQYQSRALRTDLRKKKIKAVHGDGQRSASGRKRPAPYSPALKPVSTHVTPMTVPFSRQVSRTDLAEALGEQLRYSESRVAPISASSPVQISRNVPLPNYGSRENPLEPNVSPDSAKSISPVLSTSEAWQHISLLPDGSLSDRRCKVSKHTRDARGLQALGIDLFRLRHESQLPACTQPMPTCNAEPASRCSSAGSCYVPCRKQLYYRIPRAIEGLNQHVASSSSTDSYTTWSVASRRDSVTSSRAFTQHTNPEFDAEDKGICAGEMV